MGVVVLGMAGVPVAVAVAVAVAAAVVRVVAVVPVVMGRALGSVPVVVVGAAPLPPIWRRRRGRILRTGFMAFLRTPVGFSPFANPRRGNGGIIERRKTHLCGREGIGRVFLCRCVVGNVSCLVGATGKKGRW